MSAQYLTRVISILINTNNNLNSTTKIELYSAINKYATEKMKEQIFINKKIEQLENKIEQLSKKTT